MKRMQNWLYSVFLIVVIIANITNIINQILTLIRVKGIVRTQALEIEQLKIKEKVLIDRVDYAQSSEYIEGAKRKLLGLGTEDDYWIVLPPKHSFESIYPNTGQVEPKANWRKWMNLIVANE